MNQPVELVMEKKAMLVALEQLDRLLVTTMQLELRPGLCEIYRSIQAHDVQVVPVAGVMLNLMNSVKNAKPVEPPQPRRNVVDFNGIQLDFGGL